MSRLRLLGSRSRTARNALLFAVMLGGCVSRQCPEGQKFENGTCAKERSAERDDRDAAAATADAETSADEDAGAPDSEPALQDAAAQQPRADERDAGAACGDATLMRCWKDEDGDGFAAPNAEALSSPCGSACPDGWTAREPVADDIDCADHDARMHPLRCWADSDRDTFTWSVQAVKVVCDAGCDAGWTATKPDPHALDCDDSSVRVSPGAAETCNGTDDDCDAKVDEGTADSCSFAHASGQCKSATCQILACESGFADCNADGHDGCEQALNTPDHCGGCDAACDLLASCATTDTDSVGHCSCNAPSFGDGATCQGLGPIAAGNRWTCGIDAQRHVQCLGYQNAALISDLPATTQFRQLAIANISGIGCGITLDKHLECWNADIDAGDTEFIQVVAGDGFVCGLSTNHEATCWGYGSGARSGETDPPHEKFTQLAAGFYHVCGLRADGKVLCWGAGSFSRTTNCELDARNVDCGQAQPPADAFVQLAAGKLHSCGLKADGNVNCWGVGVSAQAAPGATTDYGQAVPPVDKMKWIAAGPSHTCGLRAADGTALCWGAGEAGGTGSSDKGQSAPPSTPFVALATGWTHTCGLTLQNHLACWGDNAYGQAPTTTSAIYPLIPALP